MNPEQFDAFCLSLPATSMDVLWGADQVYKVGGKMFAVLGPEGTFSFKANDVAFEMLTQTGAAIPAPYMARNKWVFFEKQGKVPDKDLKVYLTTAHELTAAKLPKKLRRAIGLDA